MRLALSHIAIPSLQPERLRAFYVDVLGFTPQEKDGILFLWHSGPLLTGFEGKPIRSNIFHFGFRLDGLQDLDHVVWMMKRKGIECAQHITGGDYESRFYCDPDGNRLEFFVQDAP